MRIQHGKPTWNLAQEQHSNLEYFDSDLHINPSFPHYGGTPDSIINCDCCGRGLIEIKYAHSSIEKSSHTRSQIQISISSNMRMEKFAMIIIITTKYRVSLLCAIWSIVTSFAACIVNEFSQIQSTFLAAQSQHLMNFLLLFCCLDCSLVHPPLWRNL